MNILTDCPSYLTFQQKTISKNVFPSTIPAKARLAPSRNLLTPEAYGQRSQTFQLEDKIQAIADANNLYISGQIEQPLPITNHCVAASLHFAKNYRQTKDIHGTAQSMQHGVSVTCARTTAIYNELFDENVSLVIDQEVDETRFLDAIRDTTAQTVGLAFSDQVTLRYPLQEMFSYFEKELAPGEYVIPLTSHVVTLIKDPQGKLYLFDTNNGTIDMTVEEGKQCVSRLLQKHKIHQTETLTLLKITDYKAGGDNALKETEVLFSEEPAELNYEKGEGRWGVAVFKWRDKTYRLAWDSETGYIYNDDSKRLVRGKCFLLVARTCVDATVRTIYHVAMAIFKTLMLPVAAFGGKKALKVQLNSIWESVKDIFRAPFYCLLGTFAALYGLIKPLDGRRLYGYLERCLNRQNDQVNFREKHYVAPCFKPWNFGKVNDAEATIESLKRISIARQYFKGSQVCEMFFGWRRALPCFQ